MVLGVGIVTGVVWRAVENYFEGRAWKALLKKQLQEAEELQAATKTE